MTNYTLSLARYLANRGLGFGFVTARVINGAWSDAYTEITSINIVWLV